LALIFVGDDLMSRVGLKNTKLCFVDSEKKTQSVKLFGLNGNYLHYSAGTCTFGSPDVSHNASTMPTWSGTPGFGLFGQVVFIHYRGKPNTGILCNLANAMFKGIDNKYDDSSIYFANLLESNHNWDATKLYETPEDDFEISQSWDSKEEKFHYDLYDRKSGRWAASCVDPQVLQNFVKGTKTQRMAAYDAIKGQWLKDYEHQQEMKEQKSELDYTLHKAQQILGGAGDFGKSDRVLNAQQTSVKFPNSGSVSTRWADYEDEESFSKSVIGKALANVVTKIVTLEKQVNKVPEHVNCQRCGTPFKDGAVHQCMMIECQVCHVSFFIKEGHTCKAESLVAGSSQPLISPLVTKPVVTTIPVRTQCKKCGYTFESKGSYNKHKKECKTPNESFSKNYNGAEQSAPVTPEVLASQEVRTFFMWQLCKHRLAAEPDNMEYKTMLERMTTPKPPFAPKSLGRNLWPEVTTFLLKQGVSQGLISRLSEEGKTAAAKAKNDRFEATMSSYNSLLRTQPLSL
jgi:hypothetical protein